VITAVPPVPITRDGAQSAARRELSKGIYHRYDDPWPVRAFRAVQHWISHVLDTVSRHAPGGRPGAVALLIGLAVLLIAARLKLGPMRREFRTGQALLTEQATTAAGYRALAEEAAAAGRWDEAVVARMRGIARELEEQGTVDPRPGRTADELAREVAAALPPAASAMREATAMFDAVAYGGRPAGPESYAVVVAADQALQPRRRALAGIRS
jgi:hypothetical protein